MEPAKVLLTGYLTFVMLGSMLLCLPFFTNTDVPFLDNLFTSTSALSTTGLVTKTISSDYSFIGQLVILILIQIGGIGYMSIGSFIVLGQGHKLSPTNIKLLKSDFHLPKLFSLDRLVRNVIVFSFIIEALGAIALFPHFRHLGVWKGIWFSIFHSISAFCTAGFSLFPTSFEGYRSDVGLNLIIAILSIFGAIGFIVITDLWDFFRGKKERITYTTEIIMKFTIILMIAGTALIFLSEPSIKDLPADRRLLTSFFQAMTAQTTVGFNTINIGALNHGVIFVLILLMVIGASPSGTGGGIKSTTISAVFAQLRSTIRGRSDVVFLKKIIPKKRLAQAQANFTFYISLLCLGTFLLLLTEPFSFDKILFEAASGLGTVGLSMGITSSLTSLGKLILIFMMFAGRLGPLSIGTMLFSERDTSIEKDDIAI